MSPCASCWPATPRIHLNLLTTAIRYLNIFVRSRVRPEDAAHMGAAELKVHDEHALALEHVIESCPPLVLA